eukprot:11192972-Lingulodinium_polyedra.AAC.1
MLRRPPRAISTPTATWNERNTRIPLPIHDGSNGFEEPMVPSRPDLATGTSITARNLWRRHHPSINH